ncbi:ABC transporter ATP-binding protein/permease [Gammaproteobacteria bacterium]|nr:ABC transporter ATP-binding protein/permease [Gammaproteobacteria bacterium]
MSNSLKPHFTIISLFRKKALALFVLILAVSIADSFGVWLILPILEMSVNPSGSEVSQWAILGPILRSLEEGQILWILCLVFMLTSLSKCFLKLFYAYYGTLFVTEVRGHFENRTLRNYLIGSLKELVHTPHGEALNNIIRVPDWVGKGIRACLDALSQIILSAFLLGIAVLVNWQLTVSILGVLTCFVLPVWTLSGKYSFAVGSKRILLNEEANSIATNSISGKNELSLLGTAKIWVDSFSDKLYELFRLQILFTVIKKSPPILGEFIVFLFVVVGIFYTEFVADTDFMSLAPTLGFFTITFQKLYSNLTTLFSMRLDIASYAPSMIRALDRDTGTDSEIEPLSVSEKFNSKQQESNSEGLVFDKVAFGYDRNQILQGVEFELRQNEITSLVGVSGSGKSTICDLIARFYQSDSGAIRYEGSSINGYEVENWRKQIGYVSQQNYLFEATILDNLLLGREELSEKEAWRVLQDCDARDFVKKLPKGIHTSISNDSNNLSADEVLKLCLARALITNPNILILDEITSLLSRRSEEKMLTFLENSKLGRITLLITHHERPLEICDQFLQLDKGYVHAFDDAQSLISQGVSYAR